jgi:hypothetical protein
VSSDDVRVCFADEGVVLATNASVAVCIFRAPLTMARLQRIRRESETIQTRFGEQRVNLTVIEPSAVTVISEDLRKESAALMRDFPANNTATVLEGGGFRMAAARAILSGLTLLAGERSRRRIFETVEQAATWLAENNANAVPEMRATAVATLVRRARAAMLPLQSQP